MDLNTLAARIVKEATGEKLEDDKGDYAGGKNPAAVALGRLGGLKGGKARAKSLSAERRREIARKAARARWEAESNLEEGAAGLRSSDS
jgi:hypothetical protein